MPDTKTADKNVQLEPYFSTGNHIFIERGTALPATILAVDQVTYKASYSILKFRTKPCQISSFPHKYDEIGQTLMELVYRPADYREWVKKKPLKCSRSMTIAKTVRKDPWVNGQPIMSHIGPILERIIRHENQPMGTYYIVRWYSDRSWNYTVCPVASTLHHFRYAYWQRIQTGHKGREATKNKGELNLKKHASGAEIAEIDGSRIPAPPSIRRSTRLHLQSKSSTSEI